MLTELDEVQINPINYTNYVLKYLLIKILKFLIIWTYQNNVVKI